MRFSSGTRIAERYEVVKLLGSGTVGTVVHVLDRSLDQQSLALKILHADLIGNDTILQRFQSEVMFARQLAHPHIVRVYDFEQKDNYYFLSMEYVVGCDLDVIIRSYQSRKLPLQEALFLLSQIAEGLSFAHQKNIVHRDLKPHNILIDSTGLAKLTDFGLAHSLESSLGLTRTGQMPGTPLYMAPEQFLGAPPTPKVDIYAFGILAFELLTGSPPFVSENFIAIGEQHRSEPLPIELLRQNAVPDWLEQLIVDCTKKDPADRVQSMRHVLGRLSDRATIDVGQSKTILRTVVRRRQRSYNLLSTRNLKVLRLGWCLFVLSLFCQLTLFEKNANLRLASYLYQIEQQLGYDMSILRKGIGFGKFSIGSDADLFAAAQFGIFEELEALIRAGMNPNIRDKEGNTLLHHAARLPARVPQYLISDEGVADPNLQNKNGETPLLVAVKAGNKRIVDEFLMNNASPTIADKEGNTPLLWAVSVGDLAIVESLVKPMMRYRPLRGTKIYTPTQRTREGLTALHLAVEAGRVAILKILINEFADVNERDSQGQTAIMRLVQQAPTDNTIQTLELLLQHNASLSARDDEGLTAFQYADANSNQYWADRLRQHRADS